MKKISILTIIALIVMSMVFLASCDTPVDGKKPAASVTLKALTALNEIQSLIDGDTTANPKIVTLEKELNNVVTLIPTTGVKMNDGVATGETDITVVDSAVAADTNIIAARKAVADLNTRVAGLEDLVVAAAAAADAVDADSKYDGKILIKKVEAIEAQLFGGDVANGAGHADGIKTISEKAVAATADKNKINAAQSAAGSAPAIPLGANVAEANKAVLAVKSLIDGLEDLVDAAILEASKLFLQK